MAEDPFWLIADENLHPAAMDRDDLIKRNRPPIAD
jgi:hypothetical protein